MPFKFGIGNNSMALPVRFILVSHKPPLESIPVLSQSISDEEEYLNKGVEFCSVIPAQSLNFVFLVEGKSPEKIEASFQRLKLAIQKSL